MPNVGACDVLQRLLLDRQCTVQVNPCTMPSHASLLWELIKILAMQKLPRLHTGLPQVVGSQQQVRRHRACQLCGTESWFDVKHDCHLGCQGHAFSDWI